MALCPKGLVPVAVLASCVCLATVSFAQMSHADPVQVKPPLLRTIDPPSKDATVADLEARGDELHGQKLYFDAIDYYRAALKKTPAPENQAKILNKVCRTQLVMTRWHDAQKSCQQSLKANHVMPDAYNNLGVAYYEERKYGTAI